MNPITITDINTASIFTRANHEIRNMLTLIRSTLQLIEYKHPEAQRFEHWTQVMEDIKSLDGTLMDLSEYIHAAYPCESLSNEDCVQPVPRLHREYCDLYALSRRVCISFQAEALQKDISIALHVKPEALNSVQSFYCNPSNIQRILINLIKNALEAARSRSKIELSFSLIHEMEGVDGPMLSLEVRNTGSHLDADVLERIFTPYFTTKETGTGLGLPIVKQLTELHGGTITASSGLNEVTFRVLLPFD